MKYDGAKIVPYDNVLRFLDIRLAIDQWLLMIFLRKVFSSEY